MEEEVYNEDDDARYLQPSHHSVTEWVTMMSGASRSLTHPYRVAMPPSNQSILGLLARVKSNDNEAVSEIIITDGTEKT